MADWSKRVQRIQVGDTVGYSKQFLQSIGQYTGDAPLARGVVTALHPVSSELTLVEIEWNKPDLPSKVNIKNLSAVRQIQLGE